jgi:hypothetical protein
MSSISPFPSLFRQPWHDGRRRLSESSRQTRLPLLMLLLPACHFGIVPAVWRPMLGLSFVDGLELETDLLPIFGMYV